MNRNWGGDGLSSPGGVLANIPVSPKVTGGYGFEFEQRVVTLLLGRLLRNAPPPVGFQDPIHRIALQQKNAGFHLDDIVVFGKRNSRESCLQIQVKTEISATASDASFNQVVAAMVDVCRDQGDALDSGVMQLVIAAGGKVKHMKELSDLSEWAASRSLNSGFDPLGVDPFVNRSLRERYLYFREAVQLAAGYDDDHLDRLVHRILSALRVWLVEPTEDGHDWRRELEALDPIASRVGLPVGDLMNAMLALSQGYGPRAAVVDIDMLKAELRRKHCIDLASGMERGDTVRGGISVTHTGSGNVIVGEQQTINFNSPNFSNKNTNPRSAEQP